MAEPWEIKQDDSRAENSMTTFIIFCEDSVSEPIYFRSFQNGNLKVNTVDNQRAGRLNLNATVLYCSEKGLMDCHGGAYRLNAEVTENIWCVYDRDFEHPDLTQIQPVNDISFTTAIQGAQDAGLKVAWSNDAFELWVLLHFEMVPLGARLHRNYIYERLTENFKTVTPRTPELDALTANPRFCYKNAMKNRGDFITHVLPLLRTRQAVALAHAQVLEATFPAATPFHNCNPCTKVHRLVQELIAAQ